MAPSKWDDENDDSTPPSSPPQIARRGGKFDDEEDESDVAEDWDAASDSEDERKKAAAEAAKVKAEAEAKANHKSKAQRRAEHIERRQKELADAEEDEEDSEMDEDERRAASKRAEKDADLKNAQDMFGDIGISKNRTAKPITVQDAGDPTKTVELSSLSLFAPNTRDQFIQLRETLAPLVTQNSKKAYYPTFMTDFARQLVKEMGSDQIKKVASALTTASNEKMKEEKQAEKSGKKTKAAKTKTTLHASRDTVLKADTNDYTNDGLDDDDFM